MPERIEEILPLENGVTLYIGIGNTLRGDDSAGVYAAGLIKERKGLVVFNAGDNPEEGFFEAQRIKPAKTVILDAADMGLEPGSLMALSEDVLAESSLTSHKMPVSLITRLIREETGAEVVILGIQPERVDFGAEMSEAVINACLAAAKMVNGA